MAVKSGSSLGFQKRAEQYRASHPAPTAGSSAPRSSGVGGGGSPQVGLKTAYYDATRGGVVTSDGKFYPSTNPNWVPTDYIKVSNASAMPAPPPRQQTAAESAAEISRIAASQGQTLSGRQQLVQAQLLTGRLKATTAGTVVRQVSGPSIARTREGVVTSFGTSPNLQQYVGQRLSSEQARQLTKETPGVAYYGPQGYVLRNMPVEPGMKLVTRLKSEGRVAQESDVGKYLPEFTGEETAAQIIKRRRSLGEAPVGTLTAMGAAGEIKRRGSEVVKWQFLAEEKAVRTREGAKAFWEEGMKRLGYLPMSTMEGEVWVPEKEFKYDKLAKYTRRLPAFEEIEKPYKQLFAGVAPKDSYRLTKLVLGEKRARNIQEASHIPLGVMRGTYKGLRNEPTTALRNVAIGGGVTLAFIGTGGLITAAAPALALEYALVAYFGGGVLAGKYTADIYKQVSSKKGAKRQAEELGRLLSTEVGPYFAGAGVAGYAYPKMLTGAKGAYRLAATKIREYKPRVEEKYFVVEKEGKIYGGMTKASYIKGWEVPVGYKEKVQFKGEVLPKVKYTGTKIKFGKYEFLVEGKQKFPFKADVKGETVLGTYNVRTGKIKYRTDVETGMFNIDKYRILAHELGHKWHYESLNLQPSSLSQFKEFLPTREYSALIKMRNMRFGRKSVGDREVIAELFAQYVEHPRSGSKQFPVLKSIFAKAIKSSGMPSNQRLQLTPVTEYADKDIVKLNFFGVRQFVVGKYGLGKPKVVDFLITRELPVKRSKVFSWMKPTPKINEFVKPFRPSPVPEGMESTVSGGQLLSALELQEPRLQQLTTPKQQLEMAFAPPVNLDLPGVFGRQRKKTQLELLTEDEYVTNIEDVYSGKTVEQLGRKSFARQSLWLINPPVTGSLAAAGMEGIYGGKKLVGERVIVTPLQSLIGIKTVVQEPGKRSADARRLRQLLAPSVKTISKYEQISIQLPRQVPEEKIETVTVPKIEVIRIPKQDQKLWEEWKEPMPPPELTKLVPPGGGFGVGAFALEFGKFRRVRNRRVLKYQADLQALILGQRTTTRPRGFAGLFGGETRRLIYAPKVKKSRKRRG